MWYLTHRDPTKNTPIYCSLLQQGRKYTIGRGKKSDFVIKSPSVSSNHLEVQLDSNGVLEISVFGKSTYIGSDYIDRRTFTPDEAKVPELRRIKKTETVMLSSGKLASVGFHYKKISLCISSDAAVDETTLRSMGISTKDFCSSDTTHMIIHNKRRSTSQLEALICQIPILSVDYVEQLIDSKEALIKNFEENFPDHSQFVIDPLYALNPMRMTLFELFTFVFTEPTQYEVMKPVLQQARGHCALFSFTDSSGANDYVSFVNKETQRGQTIPILVQMSVPEPEVLKSHADLDQQTTEVKQMAIITEASKRLGLYLVTTEDIFNAVLQCSITHLTRKRPERTKSPEHQGEPPLKKSRRGGKVKPLDSLDFFAGGKTETQTQPMSETKETLEMEQTIPKRKQRSRIKALDNQMLDTNFSGSQELEKLQTPNASNDIPSLVTVTVQSISPQIEEPQQDGVLEEVPDSQDDEPMTESAPPQKPEAKKRPLDEPTTTQQQSFSSVIIQAKKRADERIKRELGTDVPLEEVFAVEHLRDLAIVEETDMPLRKTHDRSEELPQSQRCDAKWNGRKNFKVFVKNSKNKESNGVGRIGSVREFVSFDVYDPAYDLKITELDEDLLAFVQRGGTERAEISVDMNSTKSNVSRQPTVIDPHSVKKNPLFVASDESDDDDHEDTRFHFGVDGDDGLGMGLRISEPHNVLEIRREIGPRASTHVHTTGHSPATSRPHTMRSITTSATTNATSRPPTRCNFDDDDDDDDVDDDDNDVVDGIPRFRFG